MTADESEPTVTAVLSRVSTAVGHNFVFTVMRWQTAAQGQSAKPNVAEILQIDLLPSAHSMDTISTCFLEYCNLLPRTGLGTETV